MTSPPTHRSWGPFTVLDGGYFRTYVLVILVPFMRRRVSLQLQCVIISGDIIEGET